MVIVAVNSLYKRWKLILYVLHLVKLPLTMAQRYIGHKLHESIDRSVSSGQLSTHIGIGIPTESITDEELPWPPAFNSTQAEGTISGRHLRGRKKTKMNIQQHFEDNHFSLPNTSTVTGQVTTNVTNKSPEPSVTTQYHPLSGSTSNNNIEELYEQSTKNTSYELRHPMNSHVLHHPKLIMDNTLPTPVLNSSTVSNVSPPSGMFYLFDHFKQRLASISTYSNMLAGLSLLPQLSARRERSRSRSSGRSGSNSRTRGCSNASSSSIEDEYVFVENIELHHFDGFIFGSRREAGKGHRFEVLHLEAPTWCDSCGDFVWGVYKQCLRCKSEYHTCYYICFNAVLWYYSYM